MRLGRVAQPRSVRFPWFVFCGIFLETQVLEKGVRPAGHVFVADPIFTRSPRFFFLSFFSPERQDIRQHFVSYEAANHELGNRILAHVVPDA